MNNGEFYSSNEYNATSEYRHFPAEVYKKPNEENALGKEQAAVGKEATTIEAKKEIQKNNGDSATKSVIDKLFNSIKSVATAATVAVTAVVVTTTLVTNAPNVELLSLDYGDSYVEYEMEISELQDDLEYSIVVSTSNEEDIEIEIDENGTYKNRVEGLKPSWEYTLSLVCHDTSLGDVTHFEVKFQTLKHKPLPNAPNVLLDIKEEPIPEALYTLIYYNITIENADMGSNYKIALTASDGDFAYTFFEDNIENPSEYVGEITEAPSDVFDFVIYATIDGAEKEIYRESYTIPSIEPPSEFKGEYELPSLDDAQFEWKAYGVNHKMILPVIFEPESMQYYYRIVALDENGEEVSDSVDYGSSNAYLIIMEDASVYTFILEIYGMGTDSESLFHSHELGSIDFTPPSVDITDIKLSGVDEIDIYFDIAKTNGEIEEIEFIITDEYYGEKSAFATQTDILKGYVTVQVPEQVSSLVIQPIVKVAYGNNDFIRAVLCEPYAYTPETAFEIETIVDLSDSYARYVRFYPKAITNGATHIYISSTEDTEGILEYLYSEHMVSLESDSIITYTLYLANENGEALSEEYTVTVDASITNTSDYIFDYKNPSDVGITYNDDGTINAYIQTNFESSDQEIYYIIVLDGRYIYKSTSSIAEIVGLPNESLSINYYVCKEIDGVSYGFMRVHPSGAINESSLYGISGAFNDNTVEIKLGYTDIAYDLSSVRAVSSSGEEILLTESDFTDDTENSCYRVTLTFSEATEIVTLYIALNENISGLELLGLDSYESLKGNLCIMTECIIEYY